MRDEPSASLGWKWLAGLVVAVVLCFAYLYGALGPGAWSTPFQYTRDALYTLSMAKLYGQGEFLPFGPKRVDALNAPATAHWTDYPTTEEVVFALTGGLAFLFGPYTGANLSLLLANVLAGVCFFWAARTLGAHPPFAFAGGLAFATCHFMMRHSVAHLMLSHCWHLPLLAAITLRVLSRPGVTPGAGWHRGSLAVAAVTGAMSPYFTAMFLQLLGLAVLLGLVRREPARLRAPLQLALACLAGFAIANAETFGYAWIHGRNEAAVERKLADLQRGALELVELVRPHVHRLEALTLPGGALLAERRGHGAAYLGMAGILGLAVLVGVSLRRVATRDLARVPLHTWLVAWVLAFSVAGGINTWLGHAGFLLLRATDRYAVVVLVLALLFLVEWLSSVCPRRLVLPVAAALVALVLWDQVVRDPAFAGAMRETRRRIDSDRALAAEIEATLGGGAMLFQLPVLPFPEGRVVHRMGAYEPLRPFLNARGLRFSFGEQKGRGWDRWQRDLARLPAERVLERLEALGFGGLLIHRDAFPARAEALIRRLGRLGRSARIDSRDGTFVFVRLAPRHPPEPVVALRGRGLLPLEVQSGRASLWSGARSELVLYSLAPDPLRACLRFQASASPPRRIAISRAGSVLLEASLTARPRRVEDVCLDLEPGRNPLQLSSVSGPDRDRAFRLIELRVRRSAPVDAGIPGVL